MQTVRVKILDYEYLLKTDEDEEQVKKIAEFVSERLREIKENTGGLSDSKVAILAALHIASDYFQLLKDNQDLVSNIRQRTESLIFNIDSTMG